MAEGLRPIAVDGRRFRWRFDERLVIIPAGRSGPQLYVEWGWRDWLEPEGPGPDPQAVTPRFVAGAIRFALANGWQPEVNGPPFSLWFENDAFRPTNA
jgi:hypothetical protein